MAKTDSETSASEQVYSIIQELLKAAIVNGRFGEEIISKIVLKILTILLRKL